MTIAVPTLDNGEEERVVTTPAQEVSDDLFDRPDQKKSRFHLPFRGNDEKPPKKVETLAAIKVDIEANDEPIEIHGMGKLIWFLVLVVIAGGFGYGNSIRIWEKPIWKSTLGQIHMANPEVNNPQWGDVIVTDQDVMLKTWDGARWYDFMQFGANSKFFVIRPDTNLLTGDALVYVVSPAGDLGYLELDGVKSTSRTDRFKSPSSLYTTDLEGRKIINIVGMLSYGGLTILTIAVAGTLDRRREKMDATHVLMALFASTGIPAFTKLSQLQGCLIAIFVTMLLYLAVLNKNGTSKKSKAAIDLTSLYAYFALSGGIGMVTGYAGILELYFGYQGALVINIVVACVIAFMELIRAGNLMGVWVVLVVGIVTSLPSLFVSGIVAAVVLQAIGFALVVLIISHKLHCLCNDHNEDEEDIVIPKPVTNGNGNTKKVWATQTLEMYPVVHKNEQAKSYVVPLDVYGALGCFYLLMYIGGLFM